MSFITASYWLACTAAKTLSLLLGPFFSTLFSLAISLFGLLAVFFNDPPRNELGYDQGGDNILEPPCFSGDLGMADIFVLEGEFATCEFCFEFMR